MQHLTLCVTAWMQERLSDRRSPGRSDVCKKILGGKRSHAEICLQLYCRKQLYPDKRCVTTSHKRGRAKKVLRTTIYGKDTVNQQGQMTLSGRQEVRTAVRTKDRRRPRVRR